MLGNFLEDQDLPRWANISVDIQSLWNAMVFNWMTDGYVAFAKQCSPCAELRDSIPIMYYGQEHGFSGAADPVRAFFSKTYAAFS